MVRCLWLLYLGTLNQHLRYYTWHGSQKDACPAAVQWHDTCFAALLWQNLTFWMCWMKLKSESPTNSMGKEFPISQVIQLIFFFQHVGFKELRIKMCKPCIVQFQPTWTFCKKWRLSMRPSPVGRRTRLQQGNGTTSQSRHKTTSASSRTTLEFLVCCAQKTHNIFWIVESIEELYYSNCIVLSPTNSHY